MRRSPARHLPALLLFAAIAVYLFRLPLFGGYRFIGNPDRWNHYLSFAKFHADNLARGRFSAWSDYLFSGFDTLSLPFSFFSPLFALPPLLGTPDVVAVFAYVSPMILAATLGATYLVLHAIAGDRLAATAGALAYGLSTWSLLKLTQNDNSYLAVAVAPVLFALIRTSHPGNLGWRIALTTALIWVCIYWSFLQYFSYVAFLLVAYAAYRAVRGEPAPAVVTATSFVLAVVLGLPRLRSLAESVATSSRSAGGVVEFVAPELFLRYLDGNIFGRSFREALQAKGMNLSEGNLLFASIVASLVLIVMLIRGRYTTTVTAPDGEPRLVRYGFFAGFVVVVFLVIHFPTWYGLFVKLYAGLSFLHTRFALAALLPIALLTTLGLVRPPEWRLTRRRAVVVALLVAAVLSLHALDFDALASRGFQILHRTPKTFARCCRMENPIVAAEAVRVLVVATAFTLLLLAQRALGWLHGGTFRTVVALLIVGESVLFADHYLSGPHTRTYRMPFERFDAVLARSDQFLPPTPAQLDEMHRRLQNEAFRSVVICPRETIPIDCSSAIGMMWRIRLVEGYLSGISRRYQALPWPEGDVEIRAIRISHDPGDAGPDNTRPVFWRLLSLLNVRNAIVVTPAFYMNSHFRPAEATILENPSPYIYPRAYFAREAREVTTAEATAAIRREFAPCRPGPGCQPLLEAKPALDYVEGPVKADALDAEGPIDVAADGDRWTLAFPVSGRRRLLVINEAYDRRWEAEADGQALAIYPTNLVMRGVVVPPGVTRVTLRYRSIVGDTVRYLAIAVPLLLGAAAVVGVTRRRKARRQAAGATHRPRATS